MEAQQQPTAHGKRSGAARRKLKKEKQALLDAQFAGLVINPEKQPRLPTELVYHIMCIAAPPNNISFRSDDAIEYRRFLARLSLVCSLWMEEAQKLLYFNVSITSTRGAQSFVLGAKRGGPFVSILFLGASAGEHLDGALIGRVLAETSALDMLAILNAVDMDPATLQLPNLSHLSTLSIREGVRFRDPLTSAPFAVPYRLDWLEFGSTAWGQRHFPSALFAALCSSVTREAVLDFGEGPHGLEASLTTHSATPLFGAYSYRLESLSIRGLNLQAALALTPFFARLYTLVRLTTTITYPSILKDLPSPLKELTVLHPPHNEVFDVEEGILHVGWTSLSNLTRWSFGGPDLGLRGGRSFVSAANKRGIEVAWGAGQ